MIDISIIIVNYNVKEFLLNLLGSLDKSLKNIRSEIIVVDNASEDGSIEAVQQKYPGVKLIANNKNVGFGAANNQGMKIAQGKFIVLINPDTIVKEDTFSTLLKFFEEHEDAGMAGCKVLNPDGSLQLPCRRSFPGPWTSFTKIVGLSKLFPNSRLFARYNLTYLDENDTYEVDAISGSFMMLRKEVYEKTNGFDPQFFMYGEDLDLCYRTQKAGYKVYYVHSTEIIHYKGESTKRSSLDETKVFYDAMHLFVKKHFSSSFLVESILQAAILVRKFVAFSNLYRYVILAAVIDFLLGITAFIFGEGIYSNTHWPGFPDEVKPYVYIFPALVVILISFFFGAYRREGFSVLKSLISLFVSLLIITSATFFLKQYAFSRAVVLIAFTFMFVSFTLWRFIAKSFFKIGLSENARKNRTLIVGTGANALKLAGKLKSSLTSLNQIVGIISRSTKDIGSKFENFEIIGSLENIRKVILDKKIDKVIFASEELSFNQIFSVVSSCQGVNVEFMVSGSETDYLVGKSSIAMLDDVPLLKVYYNISDPPHKFAKFIFDFSLSVLILLFVYPFVVVYSLFVKSKGEFIRFVLSVPKVLKGKMSFVGPEKNSFYEGLYLGKQGLTGLWFIENIDRNDGKEKIKLDIFYAKNQNVWLDFEIIARTLSKILIKPGLR